MRRSTSTRSCISAFLAYWQAVALRLYLLGKEYLNNVSAKTTDYMEFMKKNGTTNQSFIKGTFIGDDLNFCNEIRSAIEITISETKKLKSQD